MRGRSWTPWSLSVPSNVRHQQVHGDSSPHIVKNQEPRTPCPAQAAPALPTHPRGHAPPSSHRPPSSRPLSSRPRCPLPSPGPQQPLPLRGAAAAPLPHPWARAFPPRRPAKDASGRCQRCPWGTAAPRRPPLKARRSTRHIARHAAAANGSALEHRRHRIARSPHRGAGCPGGGTNTDTGERRRAQPTATQLLEGTDQYDEGITAS